MGAEIAKCLKGPLRRADGYIETKEGIVTWGFGHILRQAEPEEYDIKYKSWRSEDLPIIPQSWRLLVAESCQKQFAIVDNLIKKADEIVHAGDPDREGQLLIDEVLDFVGNKKPVKRILLNALDEKSIKKAIAALRDNSEFENLKQSALARARADWLIGMNLSRAYTLAARRAGHKTVLPIGRVKTPTLALVVRRERELKNFVPVDYFTIKAKFSAKDVSFWAAWKPSDEQAGLDSEGRLLDEKIAAALLEKFKQGGTGKIASFSRQEKKEPNRLPYSLSSLQVAAGKKYGYDPQQVLDTAQKLYEKKLATYPRSDCEYLPQNQFGDAAAILKNLADSGDEQLIGWAADADSSIKSRAWNDKKISAHHAIIPTQVKCSLDALAPIERNIYFLIAQSYIAQFYPVHTYSQTKLAIDYKDEIFAASGRIVKEMGWKTLYKSDSDKEKKDDGEAETLPPVKKGDTAEFLSAAAEKKSTRPPARFTPSTLLAGMKEIHKYVKNPEAKKKLKDVYGIGTEATRANIIKELITRGLLINEPKKKTLVPTDKAYLLVDALPDEMTYPDSTAIWEERLHSMAAGKAELESFLGEQIDFTKRLCDAALTIKMPLNGEYACPRCKRGVMKLKEGKNGAFWGCSNFPHCRETCDDEGGRPKWRKAKNDAVKKKVQCPKCRTGNLRLTEKDGQPLWLCDNDSCGVSFKVAGK
jgi:DNA topoisomerase-3